MTIQNQLLASALALAGLAGCAPMETRDQAYYDHRGEYPQYDRSDYRYGQDRPPGADYRDERVYVQDERTYAQEERVYVQDEPVHRHPERVDQRGYDYGNGQPDAYASGLRTDPGCHACGVVRGITQVAGGTGDNTGAIVVGALVGGALGNTVGRGDGRRAATVVGAVAGGAVANNLTRDNDRHDLYRIDVHMNNGDMYSFDQSNHENLREGSPVEVRDGHVYPLY